MLVSIKNVLITVGIAGAAVFWAGCGLAGGTAGILATETESEKVTPAEFKLAKTEDKIAVFVSQPAWIKTPMDLRVTLTEAINAALVEKAKIKKERLIPYPDVQKCRRELADEKKDDPFEIASKLNAQYILAVQITDFELSTFAEEDLFNGTMLTKSCLFDINAKKLWPQDATEGCRGITVGFEDEKGTIKSAVEKLSAATAHCVTRYFYNCKTERFRIAEEQKELDFYTW
jgi:hypothetical protein